MIHFSGFFLLLHNSTGVAPRITAFGLSLSVNQFYVEMKLFLYPLEFCCFAKFDDSKSLSLMFAWQIPFTFPALLFCLHYWVMLTVINNKYSTLRLDIEGCWNEVAPSSCWTNFVLYDLCMLLYCVNVMLFQRRFITETYIKGSIKKCKAATSSFS